MEKAPFISDHRSALGASAGFTHVKTVGDLSEYIHDANGLTVLLMQDDLATAVTCMVTYLVGSRNEVTGTIGATHLLEHLMFKGSANHDDAQGNSVKQFLERTGARYNATTSLDRTNYYATLDRRHLEGYLAIEADRMRHLLLRDEDRRQEMTVVCDEFERSAAHPAWELVKELHAAAYIAHPYHHPTIGWRSDIEKVSIGKLRDFYHTFYWPNNATVSVIGDFQSEETLAMISKQFGAHGRSPCEFPVVYTVEPAQTGPRRVTLRRVGQLGVVAVGHKIPAATHGDYAALTVASAILTRGRSSRLYRALVDRNLATSVTALAGFHRDPSLHVTLVSLSSGSSAENVEKLILEEIARIQDEGVPDDEMRAAIAQVLADQVFDRDGSIAVADSLNECIAVGEWALFYAFGPAIAAVTSVQVQRVLRQYFQPDQSTNGWFVPVPPGERSTSSNTPLPVADRAEANRSPATVPSVSTIRGGRNRHRSAVQHHVDAGIEVITSPTSVENVVTLRGSLPIGTSRGAGGNPALPALAALMLERGTTSNGKAAIAEKLARVGANMAFRINAHTLEVEARCLAGDVALVIALLAEQLRFPAFSIAEFESARSHFASVCRRQQESADFRASLAFARAVYPQGHPNRPASSEELLSGIEAAHRDDVIAFHARHYGPRGLILVLSGDLDAPFIREQVNRAFSGWAGGACFPVMTEASLQHESKRQDIFMEDQTSVRVILGQSSRLRYVDPSYLPLHTGTAIFGSGFTSRLMANVRDKEGLTYGIGAALTNDTFCAGDWRIATGFTSTLLERGIESTYRQLKRWHEQGVTRQELESAKGNLVGAFKVGLATTRGRSEALLAAVQCGLGVTWLEEYPARIDSTTLDEINHTIVTQLDPAKMILVTAGSIAAV